MKQMNKLFVLLVIIPIVISCHSISNNITGIYSTAQSPHKFVINADSTFNYFCTIGGNIDKFSSGKWHKINKNTIVLNSNVQYIVIPLNVDIEHSDNKDPVINLKLIIPEKDEKEYRCAPQFCLSEKFCVDNFLPDRGSYSYSENYYSNERELFFKVTKEPRWFIPGRGKIEYYILETERKKIKMNDGDIINITVNVPDSLFSYRVFKQEKIKVNDKRIIFRDTEKNNKLHKLQEE